MRHMKKYADFAASFGDSQYATGTATAILERAERVGECLVLNRRNRYAQAAFGGAMWQAHRLLWLIRNGDIGDLVVDHVCRNRACVNIAHLEPVPNAVNVKRGLEASPRPKLVDAEDRRQRQMARYWADADRREAQKAKNRERMRRARAAKKAA